MGKKKIKILGVILLYLLTAFIVGYVVYVFKQI